MLTSINPIKNLGTLEFGKTHKFTFPIKNESNKTLEIKKIVVGCTSCTNASLPYPILKSGESRNVDVEFTPGSTGLQNKSLSLFYFFEGEDKEENITLKFTASVPS